MSLATSFDITLPAACVPVGQPGVQAIVLNPSTLKVFEAPDNRADHVVILHQCKHVDRTVKRTQCSAQLHLRPHKRGYLSVSCDAGHQWVWCAHCCDCGLGTRGCIMPAHWMERDSFDTGKRNHMQRHLGGDSNASPGTINPVVLSRPRVQDVQPLLKANGLASPLKQFLLSPGIASHQYLLASTTPLPGAAAPAHVIAATNLINQNAPVTSVAAIPTARPTGEF